MSYCLIDESGDKFDTTSESTHGWYSPCYGTSEETDARKIVIHIYPLHPILSDSGNTKVTLVDPGYENRHCDEGERDKLVIQYVTDLDTTCIPPLVHFSYTKVDHCVLPHYPDNRNIRIAKLVNRLRQSHTRTTDLATYSHDITIVMHSCDG